MSLLKIDTLKKLKIYESVKRTNGGARRSRL